PSTPSLLLLSPLLPPKSHHQSCKSLPCVWLHRLDDDPYFFPCLWRPGEVGLDMIEKVVDLLESMGCVHLHYRGDFSHHVHQLNGVLQRKRRSKTTDFDKQ